MTVLRTAGPDDVDAIAALYHAVWHETQAPLHPAAVGAARDLAFFRRRVVGYTDPILAAEVDGRIVGFAARRGGYLEALFVEARKRGVGAVLLAASEEAMRSTGEREATLRCLVGNDAARRFYERRGWRITHEEQLPVDGPGLSVSGRAWVMAKAL